MCTPDSARPGMCGCYARTDRGPGTSGCVEQNCRVFATASPICGGRTVVSASTTHQRTDIRVRASRCGLSTPRTSGSLSKAEEVCGGGIVVSTSTAHQRTDIRVRASVDGGNQNCLCTLFAGDGAHR